MYRMNKILLAGLLGMAAVTGVASAVEVSYEEQVAGVASDDSLQDVLPLMSLGGQVQDSGVPLSGLVDGEGARTVWLIGLGPAENGTPINFGAGPVRLAWDLESDKAELKKLSISMYAGKGGNFGGQWLASKDGLNFLALPGTGIEKQFSVSDDAVASKVVNRINFDFKPGEAAGYRYLCLELFGYNKQACEIAEIDGWIEKASPRKTFEIDTKISKIARAQIGSRLPVDQTKTPAMKVLGVRFNGTRLIVPSKNRLAVLDLQNALVNTDGVWQTVGQQNTDTRLFIDQRRSDGLRRELTFNIGTAGLVTADIKIQLPRNASAPVEYETTNFSVSEAAVNFDGAVWGSGVGPILVERAQSSQTETGLRSPYVIYPSQKEKLEVQFYMPDWYMTTARLFAYKDKMLDWELFAAVKNTGLRDARIESPTAALRKWESKRKKIEPGVEIKYRINLAVFDTSAEKPLGQIDIETTNQFSALSGVEAGTGEQAVRGRPRTLQRDKMQFIGFELPLREQRKLGHQIQMEPYQNTLEWVDRLQKSGVGFINLTSEYRDVCHGVSYQGNYDLAPPGFEQTLRAIKKADMVSTVWFTPNAFLGADIPTAKKSPMIEQHPDWFVQTSHWFGKHRTINIYNPDPKIWVMNKIKRDLERYPDLGGIYFDMFPWTSPPQIMQVGQESGLTGVQSEQRWIREYFRTIKSTGSDRIFLGNASTPMYDEHNYYDYGGIEHPLNMFLNEVVPGKLSFGHPFIQWERYGSLYFWYSALGQMYYNFCDYDQAAGYIGTKWIGWEEGQMKKNYDAEVAPYWYAMGKGKRLFGAQIAPLVRQVEAQLPNKKIVVFVSSLSNKTNNINIVPRHVKPGKYTVTAYVDTATQHRKQQFPVDIGKDGLAIESLPAFSMVRFEFAAN